MRSDVKADAMGDGIRPSSGLGLIDRSSLPARHAKGENNEWHAGQVYFFEKPVTRFHGSSFPVFSSADADGQTSSYRASNQV